MTRFVKGGRTMSASMPVVPNLQIGSGKNQFLNAAISFTTSMKKLVTKGISVSLNFIPGMQRKISKGMALGITLTPGMGKLSRLGRIFDSVVVLQAGLQRGTKKAISFAISVPLVVKMTANRAYTFTLAVQTAFQTALDFFSYIIQKTIDVLFSASLDKAQLLGAEELENSELESVGIEEEFELLSVGFEKSELGAVGVETPTLRSVD